MPSQLALNEVQEIYETILFRAPDAAGQNFWAGILDSGLLNLQQVVSSFANSPEALDIVDPIIRLYDGLFGRAPDYPGLQGWVAAADTGTSFNAIVEDFVQSQEFANDYNGGVLGTIPAINGSLFVTALYNHTLGRAPDVAGLTYWLSVLGATPTVASEAAVIEGIINSPEYIADTMNGIISWETQGASSVLANTTATDVPTPQSSNYPVNIVNSALVKQLTTGDDTINAGVTVTGDLTDYNGITPTLNTGDVIANVTTLALTDAYGNGTDLLPFGAELSNIWYISLDTAGNAGAYGGATGAWFDTTGVSDLLSVSVISEGAGIDLVQAGPTTNVNVTHENPGSGSPAVTTSTTLTTAITHGKHDFSFTESTSTTNTVTYTVASLGGGVDVIGGDNINILNFGGWGVVVGGANGTDAGVVPLTMDLPTGNVIITQDAAGENGGDVDVMGGIQVTVIANGASYGGYIDIGNTYDNTGDSPGGGATDPTGLITVVDMSDWGGNVSCANDVWITVFGGGSQGVSITANGEAVQVGDPFVENALNNTTGNISVTDKAPFAWGDPVQGGQQENIFISGGANVTVITNTGDVNVGDYGGGYDNGGPVLNSLGTGALAGTQPTGTVMVTDDAIATNNCNYDVYVNIFGGTDVTVNAVGAWVNIGDIVCNTNEDPVLLAPTGNITVIDNATPGYGAPNVESYWSEINILGGTVDPANTLTATEAANFTGISAGQEYAVYVDTNVGGVSIGDTDFNSTDLTPLSGENPTGPVFVYDTAIGGCISVDGGTTVTIVASGDEINVGDFENNGAGIPILFAPTSAITITNNAPVAYDDIINTDEEYTYVLGGTNVSVTTNAGPVEVGDWASDSNGNSYNFDPSGTVSVTDTATGLFTIYNSNDGDAPLNASSSVEVYGGTNVTIVAADASIQVGGDGYSYTDYNNNPSTTDFAGLGSDPTGNVMITVDGVQTSNQYENTIDVNGGVNVTIVTTGASDYYYNSDSSDSDSSPTLGDNAIQVGDAPVTGTVNITDTHSGWNFAPEDIDVIGGTTVNIDVGLLTGVYAFAPVGNEIGCCYSTSIDTIDVGSTPVFSGTQAILSNLADDPTGNVTITQSVVYDSVSSAGTYYGDSNVNVFTNGATTVTLIGGTGLSTIDDVNDSQPLTGSDPFDYVGNGVSTLNTVVLQGYGEGNIFDAPTVDITANGLTNLTLSDNPVLDPDPTTTHDPTVNLFNTADSTGLTITLTNEFATVDDWGNVDGVNMTNGVLDTSPTEYSTIGGRITVDAGGTLDGISMMFDAATALTFNNTASLGIADSSFNEVTTITAAGSGFLLLGDFANDSYPEENSAEVLQSITVTGTGGVYVEINPTFPGANQSFIGNSASGAGNNEVVITANPATTGTGHATVDGGGGANNTIYADFSAGGTEAAPTHLNVTHFETLGLNNAADGFYDATGYTGLVVGIYDYYMQDYDGITSAVGFSNVGANVPLAILGNSNVTISFAAAFTSPGSFTVNVGQDADLAAGVTGTLNIETALVFEFGDSGTADNLGTVVINSFGDATYTNTVNISDATTGGGAITTFTITGDQTLVVNDGAGTITTITDSDTAGVNVSGVVIAEDTTGTATISSNATGAGPIIGPDMDDTETASADTFNIGNAGGYITLGAGGDGGTVTASKETVNLTANAKDGTTIFAPEYPGASQTSDGTRAVINHWTLGTTANGQLSNAIALGTAPTIVANDMTGDLTGASGSTYYLLDGAYTLNAPSGTLTGAIEITDVETLLDANTTGNLALVTNVNVNGPGYTEATIIIEKPSDAANTTPATDTILELTGVTNILTFSEGFFANSDTLTGINNSLNFGAGASIMLAVDTFAAWDTNLTDMTNTGSTTTSVETNEQGAYSEVDLNTSAAGVKTTYDALGNWAAVHVQGGTVDHGDLVVTQEGADPQLILISQGTGIATLDEVTYGGTPPATTIDTSPVATVDPSFSIFTNGSSVDIGTLTDLSNSDVAIALITGEGGGNVTIGAISDTLLTAIDAQYFSGFLTLGSEADPLGQGGSTGLTITYATDSLSAGAGATIFASDSHDVITVGGMPVHGNVIIQAAGNNDVISVDIFSNSDGVTGGDPGAIIGAAGTTDNLTLVGGVGYHGSNSDNVPYSDTYSAPNVNADGSQVWSDVIGAAGTKDSAFDLVNDTMVTDNYPVAPSVNDTPLGAGDTVYIGDSTGTQATTAVVWLGLNNNVTVDVTAAISGDNGGTVADLWVTGDFTGQTSSVVTTNDLAGTTALGHEQISIVTSNSNNIAAVDPAHNLDLYFFNEANEVLAGGTWATSEVNVAEPGALTGAPAGAPGATSLAQALDIAAGEATTLAFNFGQPTTGEVSVAPGGTGPAEINAGYGLIDWFQYDGNTYIVEANNSTTVRGAAAGTIATAEAHAGLGTHDVVIELLGINHEMSAILLNGSLPSTVTPF